MPKPPRPWIVMPHGPLRQLDDNLWTVDSVVPGIPGRNFPRTMGVVRLSDGTLLLHNAVPLGEPTMEALGKLGRIAWLVLPSAFHCIDAHAMAARTGARVLCPAAARGAVEQVVKVDGDYGSLPQDPAVRMEPIDGASNGEGVLVVRSGPRASLLVCDLVLAVPHLPGFWGLLWRLLGFTGEPAPGPVWKRRVMTDAGAVRRTMLRLADEPGLVRLVPSHGPVLENAAAALRGAAARLAG
ncbi:MAG: hypothetical protein HZB56_19795 [Deltaproteobacteria bacterium]|nr:hypothetical protein [Deltaproteobacteria bacterium]